MYPFRFLASHTLLPPSPHTHTPFTPLWICFSAFTRHDLYRVLVLRPGFAGCLFTTIPPSCNIHKHLLGLVTGLVSLCCLLSFSWVGVMLALFLHHEFVYRLTCRPLGVVSNILLICFAFIPAAFYCSCSLVDSWSGPSISILDLRVSSPACYREDHQAVIDIDTRIPGFIPTIENKLILREIRDFGSRHRALLQLALSDKLPRNTHHTYLYHIWKT